MVKCYSLRAPEQRARSRDRLNGTNLLDRERLNILLNAEMGQTEGVVCRAVFE